MGELPAFENTEMDLRKVPLPAALYVISIMPFSPALVGFFGHLKRVHPQPAIILFIIRTDFELFRNRNEHLATVPLGRAPKL